MLKHLTERCVRGNSVFGYAAKTGQAAMIEAVLAHFPPDRVRGRGKNDELNGGDKAGVLCAWQQKV